MTFNPLEFTTLALAHFVALLSPGPDFILLVGCSLRYGYRQTFASCVGIATANALYILLAITGFSLFKEHYLLFITMKGLGAGYLLYLGWLLLKSPAGEPAIGHERGITRGEGTPRLFWRGFFSALLNPKNAVFYLSLMTLIVSSQTPLSHQFVYGLWMTGAVLFWDMLVSWLIGNPRILPVFRHHSWKIDKLSGLVLMTVGVWIILR